MNRQQVHAVYWRYCNCPRSEEPCTRVLYYDGTLCDVCAIGCGELVLIAPAGIPIIHKTILTHTKMDLSPPRPEGTILLRKLQRR